MENSNLRAEANRMVNEPRAFVLPDVRLDHRRGNQSQQLGLRAITQSRSTQEKAKADAPSRGMAVSDTGSSVTCSANEAIRLQKPRLGMEIPNTTEPKEGPTQRNQG